VKPPMERHHGFMTISPAEGHIENPRACEGFP
jgi:hypothetical protein